MNITAASRVSLCALTAALILGTPLSASAGFVRINFAEAHDFGEDWTGAFDDDLDGNGFDVANGAVFTSDLRPGGLPFSLGSAAGPSFAGTANPNPFADGLDITIDGVTQNFTSFCLSKNGTIGLGSSTSPCSLSSATSPLFSVLGGDWNYFPSPFGAPAESSVSVALGLVDRTWTGLGDTYDPTVAVPALRFFWNGVVDGPQPPNSDPPLNGMRFQAIFFDLGNGDFDVEFNYDQLYDNGIQRVSIPDGLGDFTSLFFGVDGDRLRGLSSEPYFRFRDGVFSLSDTVDPNPTPVPEPSSLWLLVAGAALLLLRRPARRATQVAR